jgi:hypothetical protein
VRLEAGLGARAAVKHPQQALFLDMLQGSL